MISDFQPFYVAKEAGLSFIWPFLKDQDGFLASEALYLTRLVNLTGRRSQKSGSVATNLVTFGWFEHDQ